MLAEPPPIKQMPSYAVWHIPKPPSHCQNQTPNTSWLNLILETDLNKLDRLYRLRQRLADGRIRSTQELLAQLSISRAPCPLSPYLEELGNTLRTIILSAPDPTPDQDRTPAHGKKTFPNLSF